MNRRGSITAELLVAACIIGLGVVLFVPSLDEARQSYKLDWIIGAVTLLSIAGCCISTDAFWRRPLLTVLATAACSAAGATLAWFLLMHSLVFSAIVAAVGVLVIGYYSFFRKGEKHETE